jgi:hypothetical protein
MMKVIFCNVAAEFLKKYQVKKQHGIKEQFLKILNNILIEYENFQFSYCITFEIPDVF